MRTVIARLEVEDDRAIVEGIGTIDYIEKELGWLEESGIYLKEARIFDEDDEDDQLDMRYVDAIFGL